LSTPPLQPHQITPEWIAEQLGIPVDDLWAFARKMETFFYPEKRIPKSEDKVRIIDPPKRQAKLFLRRLHGLLQRNRHLFHKSAHGGIARRSTFTCVRKHLGKDFLGKIDVADCFPSITPTMLLGQLRQRGFGFETSTLLCKLMTIRNRVPQGSPLSSDAINLCFYDLDRREFSRCRAHGCSYTRFIDDFTISGNDTVDMGLIEILKSEIESLGLRTNEKSVILNVNSDPMLVHSLDVRRKQGERLKQEHLETIHALTGFFVIWCQMASPDNLNFLVELRMACTGWLNYCRQAQISPAKHITRMIKVGDNHVIQRMRKAKVDCKSNKWWTKKALDRIAKIWVKHNSSAENIPVTVEIFFQ